MEIIFVGILFIISVLIFERYTRYSKSNYRNTTSNGFWKTILDKGNYGEFLTFCYLEKIDIEKKLMTNLYLPRKDEGTTEIDLIMLTEKGIFVFESKNYSGWIFGDEKNKNWTQTFQNKQKNHFFNPIWQNNAHISALKSILNKNNKELYKSYIVFSERCTLKRINVESSNTIVLKRNFLLKEVKNELNIRRNILSLDEVETIYKTLKNFEKVEEGVKKAHIENILKKSE